MEYDLSCAPRLPCRETEFLLQGGTKLFHWGGISIFHQGVYSFGALRVNTLVNQSSKLPMILLVSVENKLRVSENTFEIIKVRKIENESLPDMVVPPYGAGNS